MIFWLWTHSNSTSTLRPSRNDCRILARVLDVFMFTAAKLCYWSMTYFLHPVAMCHWKSYAYMQHISFATESETSWCSLELKLLQPQWDRSWTALCAQRTYVPQSLSEILWAKPLQSVPNLIRDQREKVLLTYTLSSYHSSLVNNPQP